MANEQLIEAGAVFLGGINSSLAPQALPENQLSWATNLDLVQGLLSPREGFDQVITLPSGKLQLFTGFTSTIGSSFIIAGINGRLYASKYPFDSYFDLGVSLSSSAQEFYSCEVTRMACGKVTLSPDKTGSPQPDPSKPQDYERTATPTRRYIIIQDGSSEAVIFDGVITTRGNMVNHGIPKGTHMAWDRKRLWVWDNANYRLQWSNIGDPFSFYDVGFLTGGGFEFPTPITGLHPYLDSGKLLVFEEERTWVLNTDAPIQSSEEEWKAIPGFKSVLLTGIGCLDGKSFVRHWGDLYWQSNRGLTSIKRAAASESGDSWLQLDREMDRSAESITPGAIGFRGGSHGNYFLWSVPNPTRDLWVQNFSPVSLANKGSNPVWVGVWEGIKAHGFVSFYTLAANISETFALAKGEGNSNIVYQLFNGSHFDNDDQPIRVTIETRIHPFRSIFFDKTFRFADLRIQKVWGDVFVDLWYRGTRGSWKRLLDGKAIRAAEDYNPDDSQITQSRRITSPTQRGIGGSCIGCGPPGYRTSDNIDGGFQLKISLLGQAALESYLLAVDLEVEQELSGRCQPDEEEPYSAPGCDDSDTPPYATVVLPESSCGITVTATAVQRRCFDTDTSASVSYSGRSLLCDPPRGPNLTEESEGASPPPQTYTSTQSYTATCLDGEGDAVTKTATETSLISQRDADTKARNAAKLLAEEELACTWTSTQSFTAYCEAPLVGVPVTKTATYTSSISREDADEQALELATLAAETELVCVTDFQFLVLSSTGPAFDGKGVSRILRSGLVDTTWTAIGPELGAGNPGSAYAIIPGFVGGNFDRYNGSTFHGLVGIDDSGNTNPIWTQSAFPIGATVYDIQKGADGFVAVTGVFGSTWFGVSPSDEAYSSVDGYVLFDPTDNSIISTKWATPGGTVRCVASDSTNRRYLGGDFLLLARNSAHPTPDKPRPYICRVEQDGSFSTWIPDDTLPTPSQVAIRRGPDGPIHDIAVNEPRNSAYVLGQFTTFANHSTTGVAKIWLDGPFAGQADTNFAYTGERPQANAGALLLRGNNLYVSTGFSLFRLSTSTGKLDNTWPMMVVDGSISKLVDLGASGFLVVGGFSRATFPSDSREFNTGNAIILRDDGGFDPYNTDNFYSDAVTDGYLIAP